MQKGQCLMLSRTSWASDFWLMWRWTLQDHFVQAVSQLMALKGACCWSSMLFSAALTSLLTYMAKMLYCDNALVKLALKERCAMRSGPVAAKM